MNSTHLEPVAQIVEAAKDVLLKEPGLRLAILHGSAAAGKMRDGSDVDLALLFDQPLDAAHKMMLGSRLEAALRRDVDLVDLYSLGGTILKQALKKGVVLIQNQEGARAELLTRMIYNQADMMPYVTRTLVERQRRFVHG